jgi:hypothetical protein
MTTNQQIADLNQNLPQLGNLSGEKFNAFYCKNKRIVAGEIKSLGKKVYALREKYIPKVAEGEKADETVFMEEYQKLMEQETKVKLHMIKKENVPEHIIASQEDVIFDLIIE